MIKILLSTRLGERRWTQKKLSDVTGIRPSTIGELYNELVDRVNLEHLEKICRALECDISELLVLEPGIQSDTKKPMTPKKGTRAQKDSG